MSEYRTLPLTAEKGLLGHIEDSMMPPGFVAKLENWVPDASGSLKPRVGWLKPSATSAPSTKVARGIGYSARQPSYETPTIVQSTTTSYTSSTSVTVTWPASTTNGSDLLAVVMRENPASTVTAPGGWTLVGTGGSSVNTLIYKILNSAVRSGGETWSTTPSATGWVASLFEFTNTDDITTADELDGTGSSPQTLNFDPVTVTKDPSMVLSFATNFMLSGTSCSITTHLSPWTTIINIDTSSSYAFAGSRILTDTTIDPPSLTATASGGTMAFSSRSVLVTPALKSSTSFDLKYLVANAESSDYKIYRKDGIDLSTGSWTLVDTITPSSGVVSDPVAFATGLNRTFYTSHRFAALRAYDSVAQSYAEISNGPAGRCVAFHKNRLFVGGTQANLYRLYYSNINDETTWGVNDYIDIGKDDGEPIEDITPFRNALFIGKKTSLWYLTGSGPDTFTLTKLPTGGIAPGRSLMPTPYGVIAVGARHIWMADSSGEVSLISRPINDSYQITTWASTSFINDVVSIVDAGVGTVWSLDLATGVWYTEKHDNANEAPAVLYNYDYTQLMAPRNASIGTLLSYRNIPGSPLAKDFDTLTETYKVWTPEMWPLGPGTKVTPRHLMYKVRQRSGSVSQTGITVYTYGNGAEIHRDIIGPWPEAGVYRERLDVGGASGIDYVQFRFEQTVPSGQTSVFDIEELIFGYDVEPRR